MRIAFVAQPFDRLQPPVQGSSLALWLYQVARRCAERGHPTFAFANQGRAFGSGLVRSEKVDYIYTPTGLNRLLNRLAAIRNGASGVSKFASPWRDYGYAREVGRRSRQLRCDVINVINYSQFVPVIRHSNPGCKICLHMQCEWLTQLDPALIVPRLESTDLIVGCSEYITKKIIERFPKFEQRCVTVTNAASPVGQSEELTHEPFHVLFVGRLSPEKGVHDLIAAFHEVLKRFPEARLHLVGGAGSAPLEFLVGLSDEPQVMALRKFYEPIAASGKDPYLVHLERAAGTELGKRILFSGRVNHSETESHYRRAAVLVNPSLSESFGMTLVEAMMHHVPVVATRVGGMPYIVDHGHNGLLVAPADPPALAQAICQLFENREAARQMGEAGRRKAMEKFSWERTTDVLLEHCQRLLN